MADETAHADLATDGAIDGVPISDDELRRRPLDQGNSSPPGLPQLARRRPSR
jgi:hypothetical protein